MPRQAQCGINLYRVCRERKKSSGTDQRDRIRKENTEEKERSGAEQLLLCLAACSSHRYFGMGNKMRRFDYVLFDLDGTLTDSAEGISKGLQLALREQGVIIENARELDCYAGPPLDEIFSSIAPWFQEEHIRKATGTYRAYYNQQGWKESRPFPGADRMLSRLKEAGLSLATASSKPTEFVKRICEYFQLDQYLHHITGGDVKHNRFEKADVVSASLKEFDQENRDRTVLVGDRVYDVVGGHKEGLKVIGLSFGYARPGELEEAGCDVILDSYEELEKYLLEELTE